MVDFKCMYIGGWAEEARGMLLEVRLRGDKIRDLRYRGMMRKDREQGEGNV